MILVFILSFFKANITLQKKSNKKNIIYFYDFYNFKVFFILLLKIIIIYIRFSQIYIWKSSF